MCGQQAQAQAVDGRTDETFVSRLGGLGALLGRRERCLASVYSRQAASAACSVACRVQRIAQRIGVQRAARGPSSGLADQGAGARAGTFWTMGEGWQRLCLSVSLCCLLGCSSARLLTPTATANAHALARLAGQQWCPLAAYSSPARPPPSTQHPQAARPPTPRRSLAR